MIRRAVSFVEYASLWIVGVSLFVAGCSNDANVPVYPATGKLMVNGEPAVGAIIGLHPTAGDFDTRGTRPAAQVQSDGTFVISSFGIADGAPAGDYRVSIFWPQFPGRDDPGEDRLMGEFANPDSSDIHVKIKQSDNTLDPIVLNKVKLRSGKS